MREISDLYDEGSDLYIMIKSNVTFGFKGEYMSKHSKKSTKKSGSKPVKSVKKAKSAKASKPVKPHSGQSGPKIDVLPWEKMNEKEQLVFKTIARSKELTLEALAEKCFAKKSAKKANSWTRNSLRRLVRAGLVKRVDEGTYKLGGKKLQHVKLDAKKAAKKVAKKVVQKAPKKAPKAKKKLAAKPKRAKAARPVKSKAKSKSNSMQAMPQAPALATAAGGGDSE